jgi:hypothetical protein
MPCKTYTKRAKNTSCSKLKTQNSTLTLSSLARKSWCVEMMVCRYILPIVNYAQKLH